MRVELDLSPGDGLVLIPVVHFTKTYILAEKDILGMRS